MTYTTVDEVVALLSRTWTYCPPLESDHAVGLAGKVGTTSDGRQRVGIEFTSDGHLYWLAAADDGSAMRGRGITETASYEILTDNNFQLDITWPDLSEGGWFAVVEKGPTRLVLKYDYAGWFVPLTKTPPTGDGNLANAMHDPNE